MATKKSKTKVKDFFPILTDEEILVCLHEIGIELSEEDFLRPKPETIKNVYDQFVIRLAGMTKEELGQPVADAMDFLEYPELHDESIGEMEWIRKLIHIMRLSEVNSFNIRDLFKPEYARTKRNLSAVINFAKFREQALPIYTDIRDNHDDLLDERMNLQDNIDNYTQAIQEITAQRQQEEEEVEMIEEECAGLVQNLTEVNDQQAQLQGDIGGMKTETMTLMEQITTAKYEILNTKTECEQLRSQIIHSPEKVTARIAELHKQIEDDKENMKQLQEQSNEMTTTLSTLDQVYEELSDAVKIVQKAQQEMEKCTKEEKQVAQFKERAGDCEQQIRELSKSEENLKRFIQSQKDKLKRLKKQKETKQEKAHQAEEEVRAEKEQLEKERSENTVHVGAVQNNIDALDAKHTAMMKSHEKEMAEMRSLFNQLDVQTRKYHEGMRLAQEKAL